MSFFTVVSYKGGVTKTTTAVHLAAFLQRIGPTLLIDGDPNRSVSKVWAVAGKLTFAVVDESQGAYEARNYQHVVIDTEARPGGADFEALSKGCDLMVIPAVPAKLDTAALSLTINAARQNGLADSKFRVLITKAPPPPEKDAIELRLALEEAGIPLFGAEIPRLKAFEHAVVAGVAIYDLKGNPDARRGAAAYEAAWDELDPALLGRNLERVKAHG